LREEIIERGVGAFRPGSVRLAVHYLNTPEEVQYTIDALKLIAQHGYRFLPYFKVDLATGNYEYTGPQLKIQKTKSISKNSSYSRQITFLNQLQNAELFFKKLPEPRDSEDYVSQTLNGQRHLYVGSPSAFGNIQLLQKQPRKKKSALLVANH
jgi:hypothetical protein